MTIFAAIQLKSTNDYLHNVNKSIDFINEASKNGAKVVALPEVFTFIGDNKETDFSYIQSLEGDLVKLLSETSKKNCIYLIAGSIHELISNNDKSFNTTIVFSPDGEILDTYRKIHLFNASFLGQDKESNKFEFGDNEQAVIINTDLGNFGLTICHDLRFPEMFRKLSIKGADIIFVPSAFVMKTGKDHWEVLLRARAIENQVYIVAPAQFGKHNERKESYGNTMIVDPWGKVIARASDREQVIYADIDLSYLSFVRSQLETVKQIQIFKI
jgi:predicted amidohydrolase